MLRNADIAISVIIVSWNVRDLLRRCLLALNRHLKNKNYKYEIIVVDNASHDGSVEMVEQALPEVKVIKNRENVGFAAANNQAARIAKGMFLLFVNPDTELQDDIETLLEHFRDQRVAAVFGKLIYPNGQIQLHTLKRFPTFLNQTMELLGLVRLFPNIKIFNAEEKNGSAYERTHYVDWGAGAFFVFRKDLFEQLGMFDEDYFVYGEEMDLFFKVKRRGYKSIYEPRVHIIHHVGSSTKQHPGMYLMLHQNKVLFMKKNYNSFSAICYRYFFLVMHQTLRGIHSLLVAVLTKDRCWRKIFFAKMKNQFNVVKWALFS